MLIELHRHSPEGRLPDDESRVAIELDDIRQVHEGFGGVTIITTPMGKIPVVESYDQVKRLKEVRNGF